MSQGGTHLEPRYSYAWDNNRAIENAQTLYIYIYIYKQHIYMYICASYDNIRWWSTVSARMSFCMDIVTCLALFPVRSLFTLAVTIHPRVLTGGTLLSCVSAARILRHAPASAQSPAGHRVSRVYINVF